MESTARLGVFATGIATMALMVMLPSAAPAAGSTTAEIDAKVDAALARLKAEVPGSSSVIQDAKGVLVFAEVIKAGFVVAGEGGEGALRIGGKSAAYYTIFSGSVGFQAGGQKRDIIVAFLDDAALKKFRESKGWQAGIDGTITLIDVGASGTIDTTKLKEPIIGFIVGQKGLMAGISLDGSKITKLER